MKACKPNVQKPYKYDSYVISELKFDKKPKIVEVVFTAFEGQKYKLIFCTNGFEEAVKLNIYNKSKAIKQGRKKLYDNEQGIDNNFWTFEQPISYYHFLTKALGWTNLGIYTAGGCVGCESKRYIDEKHLQAAYERGLSLV